jgi:hypothetical protein
VVGLGRGDTALDNQISSSRKVITGFKLRFATLLAGGLIIRKDLWAALDAFI